MRAFLIDGKNTTGIAKLCRFRAYLYELIMMEMVSFSTALVL